MAVARHVDVVVQNHTPELLTIEDAMNIQGTLDPPGPPRIGGIIPAQGSGKWTSVSPEEDVAAQGYIRFGCTKGYMHVAWCLPRAADQFEVSVAAPDAIAHRHRIGGQNDDFRVVVVTLTPYVALLLALPAPA